MLGYKCECHGVKHEDSLEKCDEELLPPNIREVQRESEELTKHSKDAMEKYAITDDLRKCIENFKKAVQNNSKAIINIDCKTLVLLVETLPNESTKKHIYKEVFKTHYDLVKDKIIPPDKQREIADDIVFGKYKEKIRFASLSLNNTGLHNYGELCVHLQDSFIEENATLLCENSQFFPNNYQIEEHKDMPSGHRALWNFRGELAVAKLAEKICDKFSKNGGKITDEDFAKLLLCCGDRKRTDEFIEIHIYGPFTMEQVNEVHGKPSLKVSDKNLEQHLEQQAMLERCMNVLEDKLEKIGIEWKQKTSCK